MISQSTFSRSAFEQWLAKFRPSNTVESEISPADDPCGISFPQALFKYWVRLEVSPVPIHEINSRLVVLYEHPIIVSSPNWLYYVVNNMLSLCQVEHGKVPKWGQLQDALEILNEGDAELQLGLAKLCNRKKFLEFCGEAGRLVIDHDAHGYADACLISVLMDYAHQLKIEFDEMSFYMGKLILKNEEFYAELIATPWWWNELGAAIELWAKRIAEGNSPLIDIAIKNHGYCVLDYAECAKFLGVDDA